MDVMLVGRQFVVGGETVCGGGCRQCMVLVQRGPKSLAGRWICVG